MNLNKVILIGRLTRDPETRTTPNGQNVASFGLATNRVWTDNAGNKQEKTSFHNIVTWGKLADLCQQYIKKGQEVYIEGRMDSRSWEDPQGNKKNRTDIIAQTVQFGSKPRGTEASDSSFEKNTKTKKIDASAPQEEEIDVEEIPF